jgi:hypothetical protein
MSAYDMIVSDAIYGPTERYVSRSRLNKMLEYEFQLQHERLSAKRGDTTKFFVFADTVTARGTKTAMSRTAGWAFGFRRSLAPNHRRSLFTSACSDRENLQQQEALGIMGVNLIHSAMYPLRIARAPAHLPCSTISPASAVEVDMVKLTGPAFLQVDNRLMSLQLVESGLADSAMFTQMVKWCSGGSSLQKGNSGRARQFSSGHSNHFDMLNCAQAQFVQEPGVQVRDLLVVDGNDHEEPRDRIGHRSKGFSRTRRHPLPLGQDRCSFQITANITAGAILFRYTKKMIGLVMGVPSCRKSFEEKYYSDLDGGILESFGRLFKNALKLYVYPVQDKPTGAIITANNLRVAPHLQHLYAYLVENHFIQAIKDYNECYLPIFSREVLALIKSGDAGWELMVPPQVAAMIKERKLFGYSG